MAYNESAVLDHRMRDAVQSEVRPGERLIWSSQPVARYFAVQSVIPMVFGIPWTAFSLAFGFGPLIGIGLVNRDMGVFGGVGCLFSLFSIPFVLIGFGLLTAPLWHHAALKRTAYAITDARAIVVQFGVFGARTVQSFDPDRLTKMERTEKADGSGNLIFEEFVTRHGTNVTTNRRGFMSVPNVRDVENLIRSTLLQGRVRNVNA